MSKSILIIDVPEDFDYRRCSIGGDGNIYYERKGEQRTSIIGNIRNLKPMPQYINSKDEYNLKFGNSNINGWNSCIDDILGEEVIKENSINYYVIENTVNEYESRITGKYATIDEARNDIKNHYDWYVSEPCGNIYRIKEWFDGFDHKVEKTFIERHFGNEITYKEY